MSKKMWLVRAGEGAYLFNEFKEKQAVAIGWSKLKNMESVTTLQAVKTLLKSNYPEYKDGKTNITAGQIYRFVCEFQVNDEVITYDPEERLYYIGNITSKYDYNPGFITDKPNVRKVSWTGSVSRDSLSASARNTLGSILTIITIPDEVRSEVYSQMGKQSNTPEEESEEETDELELIKADIILKSKEFIKDKIANLDWEQMQELVAGILRGMGYKTRISPKGPDRGRDILASPDGLGLEEPRIMVEVKHRSGQMGANEIRSFTGGLRLGDRGIYVSTGGFSKEAKYEAERSNNPLSLVDLDFLVELVTQYYDQFDAETRTLVPLRKIYWPA
ncbi:restriction endonuclease [Paenibacillus radicis (ex Xue et al. 2023)]|uniref:Restriction endonuclease n=1 Tax=Paenibacillus radicis (ex Xue et al. 2023) TaxID=2972489 RepID=A0ABT1YTT3_9BACL|nr:restriction endonuclease [Paenibacillus radicis (ex Xue et al. 2023)]MCR8636595.1 restriction endonuclease [Paenibacillus radicis (ex Xue et al. 2023)]